MFILCILLALLSWSPLAFAASAQYRQFGTGQTYTDGGSGEVTMTTANVTTSNGRVSAQRDWGSGAQPFRYCIWCTFQVASAPTVGNVFEIYAAVSDGTNQTGEVGTSDAGLSSDKRNNLLWLFNVLVDQTSTNTDMTGGRCLEIPARFWSLAYWNASGVTTRNTAGSSFCEVIPYYFESQ